MNRFSDAIRFISWKNLFKKSPHLFEDYLSNYTKKNYESIFESAIHKLIINDKTDDEIINFFIKSNNLFVDETISEIKSKYNIEKKDMTEYYQKHDYNFLISTDELYPNVFKETLLDNLKTSNKSDIQFIPNVFVYQGNLNLISKKANKHAIIGTRKVKNLSQSLKEIQRIHKRSENNICVTGLASGIDSLSVNVFEKSIVFIGEEMKDFIKKDQKDKYRRKAKLKVLNNGLILTHILPHNDMTRFDYINSLLQRNLFIVLISDTIHPIEFGIRSGTISAINHAIKNSKKIYSPKSTLSDEVIKKYKDNIIFY